MKRSNYFFILLMLCAFNVQTYAVDKDYVLDSHAKVQEFVNGGTGFRENVGNLTVSGPEITQTDFNSLADRILAVNGTVTFQNLTHPGKMDDGVQISSIGGFFNNIKCNGGIKFINCPTMVWPDGFNKDGKMIRHVYGDFVIDNCGIAWSGVDGWASDLFYSGIQEVDGDFIIRNFSHPLNMTSGSNLVRVGGSFEISRPVPNVRAQWVWEPGFSKLKTVGGNFTINMLTEPNMKMWSLTPLASIESIGGDVKIMNIAALGLAGSGDLPYGYCYVRYLIDNGAIDYARHDVVIGNGAPIDLATLGGCANGYKMDVPPLPLPPKYTAVADIKSIVNNVIVKDNALLIDCNEGIDRLEVISVTGVSMLNYDNVEAGRHIYNVGALKSGVYLVKLSAQGAKSVTYKVVKN